MSRSHPRDIFHFSHNNKMCHKQAPKSEHSATHGCLFFFAFCNLTVFFICMSDVFFGCALLCSLYCNLFFHTRFNFEEFIVFVPSIESKYLLWMAFNSKNLFTVLFQFTRHAAFLTMWTTTTTRKYDFIYFEKEWKTLDYMWEGARGRRQSSADVYLYFFITCSDDFLLLFVVPLLISLLAKFKTISSCL